MVSNKLIELLEQPITTYNHLEKYYMHIYQIYTSSSYKTSAFLMIFLAHF